MGNNSRDQSCAVRSQSHLQAWHGGVQGVTSPGPSVPRRRVTKMGQPPNPTLRGRVGKERDVRGYNGNMIHCSGVTGGVSNPAAGKRQ